MRKIFLIIISLIMITGCSYSNKEYKYRSTIKHEEVYTQPIDITYSEFESKIQNKDSFILMMWQTGCSHCQTFEPILEKVISKYNIEVYSINIAEITEVEYSKLKNKTFVTGTPTTVVFKDGVIESKKLVGSKSEEELSVFLVRHGYLEENN